MPTAAATAKEKLWIKTRPHLHSCTLPDLFGQVSPSSEISNALKC